MEMACDLAMTVVVRCRRLGFVRQPQAAEGQVADDPTGQGG
jgi:hypothetical protein